jgi:hypothetical protein
MAITRSQTRSLRNANSLCIKEPTNCSVERCIELTPIRTSTRRIEASSGRPLRPDKKQISFIEIDTKTNDGSLPECSKSAMLRASNPSKRSHKRPFIVASA